MLFFASKSDYTITDSLIVFFLGMLIIFAVLALLAALTYAMKFLNKSERAKVRNTEKTDIETKSVDAGRRQSEDDELASVISAAIMAYNETESSGHDKAQTPAPFKIKKIKKK